MQCACSVLAHVGVVFGLGLVSLFVVVFCGALVVDSVYFLSRFQGVFKPFLMWCECLSWWNLLKRFMGVFCGLVWVKNSAGRQAKNKKHIAKTTKQKRQNKKKIIFKNHIFCSLWASCRNPIQNFLIFKNHNFLVCDVANSTIFYNF